jgi:hypothetical protein
MRSTALHAVVVTALLGVGAVVAGATEYPAWGDTGWTYSSKRECCNAAIQIAQQYSEQECTNTGGLPSPFEGGGQRGSCNWEWTQDGNGNLLYRCYSQASVWCDQ